jgi:transcriptional regulator with XRE-family HTH domain
MTLFGKWLEELQGDMTETELASRVGISRQQIHRIKTGQSGLNQKTIMALAAAVGGKAEDALRLAFSGSEAIVPDVELTRLTRNLPAHEYRRLLNLVRVFVADSQQAV